MDSPSYAATDTLNASNEVILARPFGGRPRSGSAGLDALAALAMTINSEGKAPSMHLSSSDDDSEAMPPPPPRRARSVSNPEGMEKWDSLSTEYSLTTRKHFVLPSCILEEELAEASAAAAAFAEEEDFYESKGPSPSKKIRTNEYSSSPDSVASPMAGERATADDQGAANASPQELLRRARARLFEDLSEGNLAGDKGVMVLPHSLPKYNNVYNKNGRIGIYTPKERAAIIARFQLKRSRRVWNKKIRYNCRKSLADRRMRVKGRFVKRATEDLAKAIVVANEVSPPVSGSTSPVHVANGEESLPDVNDPEAGFIPTEDQPFRRTRRHTIT